MSKHLFLWTSDNQTWRAVRVEQGRTPRFVPLTEEILAEIREERMSAPAAAGTPYRQAADLASVPAW
jgi:hypothetical protein